MGAVGCLYDRDRSIRNRGGNVPIVIDTQTIICMGHDERSAKFTDDEIVDPLVQSDYKAPPVVAIIGSKYEDDRTIMHGNRTSERRNYEGGESDIDG